ARQFLDAEPAPDLDRVIPYDGAIAALRATGLPLRFALMSIAAHHFQHVGEIVTIRSRLGHALKDSADWGRALICQIRASVQESWIAHAGHRGRPPRQVVPYRPPLARLGRGAEKGSMRANGGWPR